MRTTLITTLFVVGLLAMGAVAHEPPKSEEGVTPVGQATRRDSPQPQPAEDARSWITYDDGSAEDWGTSYSPLGAVGNRFVQLGPWWYTFFCNGLSAYLDYNGNVWMTGYRGLNTAGTALTGYQDDLMSNTGTGTGWLVWDYSTQSGDFFGNPSFAWQDTAWIAAYYLDDIGVDTNGGAPHHGFSVTSYTGIGYAEESMNALLRARFEVTFPIELMSFTVE
jgi:hypothetical protein